MFFHFDVLVKDLLYLLGVVIAAGIGAFAVWRANIRLTEASITSTQMLIDARASDDLRDHQLQMHKEWVSKLQNAAAEFTSRSVQHITNLNMTDSISRLRHNIMAIGIDLAAEMQADRHTVTSTVLKDTYAFAEKAMASLHETLAGYTYSKIHLEMFCAQGTDREFDDLKNNIDQIAEMISDKNILNVLPNEISKSVEEEKDESSKKRKQKEEDESKLENLCDDLLFEVHQIIAKRDESVLIL